MIRIAKGIDMPLGAITQTFAFLGKRGGGKTYGAGKLAEEMLIQKAQIIVLDVVGSWYGLRIPKHEENKPFDIVIFGGQHIGIDHTGGHFSNTIGPLSTAGLITRRGGVVTPTDVLFPAGLF